MDQQNPANPPEKTEGGVSKQYAFGAIVALAVTASFVAGVFIGDLRRPARQPLAAGTGQVLNKDAKPDEALQDVDFQQFWDVWKTVKERYVEEPPTDSKMFYGAVAGMVGSLGDPYSVFFDPETAQKFTKELEGEFEGIGAEIGIKGGVLTVIAPLPGTPADKAGIQAGDKVLAIDGVDTSGMIVDDAVSRIRGDKGTKVKLLVMREGFKEPKEFEIVRDKITVESVKWKTKSVGGKKIGIITITHFNEKTESKFNEAVRALLLEDIDGVVLDLRNNPGGFLDTAVAVSGEWISHDVVVVEKFSDGTKKPYSSDGSARLSDVPTVVLVNGGSASASEIVAGALKDHAKATIVGEKSYGKGSVQDYTEFPDRSALKLTVALWLTPSGRSINKEGIEPDMVMKMTPEDFEADKDPQLDLALDVLTGKAKVPPRPAAAAPAPPAPSPAPATNQP
ncbi:MAG TPA: S41 family peptidase [Candidatus Binatia bacterium]|jgi:carboxyl-terminal processing protease|nr:S41 family peptidase [Candidatus Binatia bacterium]